VTVSVVASDVAGNALPVGNVSGEKSFTVDNIKPTVSIGAPSPNQTSTGPVTFTITYSGADTITLAAANVTLNKTGVNTGAPTVSGSGTTTRTVTIGAITGDGTLGISIVANTASDLAGNQAAAAGPSGTCIVDNTPPPPTISIGAPSVDVTRTANVTFTVTYAGATSVSLVAGNITLNKTGTANGTVGVSGTGTTTRTVTISSISGDGTLGISIAAGTAIDGSSNLALAAGPSYTFTVDNTAPYIISVSSPGASDTPLTLTFSEPVYGDAAHSTDIVKQDFADVTSSNPVSSEAVTAISPTSNQGCTTLDISISWTLNPIAGATLTVNALASKIYDYAGNAMATNTGVPGTAKLMVRPFVNNKTGMTTRRPALSAVARIGQWVQGVFLGGGTAEPANAPSIARQTREASALPQASERPRASTPSAVLELFHQAPPSPVGRMIVRRSTHSAATGENGTESVPVTLKTPAKEDDRGSMRKDTTAGSETDAPRMPSAIASAESGIGSAVKNVLAEKGVVTDLAEKRTEGKGASRQWILVLAALAAALLAHVWGLPCWSFSKVPVFAGFFKDRPLQRRKT
jgi:hypothetical protein